MEDIQTHMRRAEWNLGRWNANSNSSQRSQGAHSEPSGSQSGLRKGAKFDDLGATAYGDMPNGRSSSRGEKKGKKEKPGANGRKRETLTNGRLSKMSQTPPESDASSDELNLTDASSTIGSPSKPVNIVEFENSDALRLPGSTTKKPASHKHSISTAVSKHGPSKLKVKYENPDFLNVEVKSKRQYVEPRTVPSGINEDTLDISSIEPERGQIRRPRPAYGSHKKKPQLLSALEPASTPKRHSDQEDGLEGQNKTKKSKKDNGNPIERLLLEKSASLEEATLRPKTRKKQSPPSSFSSETIPGESNRKTNIAPFPMISPTIRRSEKTAHSLNTNVWENEDSGIMDGEPVIKTRGGHRPFPMSSQEFKDISSKPPSSSSLASSSTSKRDSSGNDDPVRLAKKKRRSDGMLEDFEDFSFTQAYERADPRTLCPYCDQLFPSSPSPLLLRMLDRVRNVSYRDPRPANALGLRAPLLSYVNMCQRHQFETTLLPKAHAHGWPTKIDFAGLPERIEALSETLQAYLLDKEKSEFWKELKKEIKKKGVSRVMGIAGQFGAFEKSQPGYYGEQGSVIIHQTLYNIFPLAKIDAELIAPINPTEFIQRVLVPEAAAALVLEDMGFKTKVEAIKTLRESSSFGTAMFPDLDSCEGGFGDGSPMGVGDKMVRERARARRREVEKEDRMEEEQAKQSSREVVDTARCQEEGGKKKSGGTRGTKGKCKATTADEEPIELSDSTMTRSEASVATRREKGKSRARADALVPEEGNKKLPPLYNADPTKRGGKPRPRFVRDVTTDIDVDDEATPKPSTRIREDLDATTDSGNDAEKRKGALYSQAIKSRLTANVNPLDLARARRAPRCSSDVWSYNMDQRASSDNDDASLEAGQPRPVNSAGHGKKSRPESSNKPPKPSRQHSNSWLLSSDDVTPDSSPDQY